MQLLIPLIGLLLTFQDHRQEITIEDELAVNSNERTVVVDNIFGKIKVKKSQSQMLSIQVLKTFEAGSPDELNQGIQEVQLRVLRRNDSIILYADAPFICSKWNGCYSRQSNRDEPSYSFRFDYVIELPASLNLNVSTINEGDIEIDGIQGQIKARNVNGDVAIKEAKSVARVSTVNGNVTVHYEKVPYSKGEFQTINGSINIYGPDEFNAVIAAKSMHGDLFTNFDYQQGKQQLVREVSENETSTTYKLEETFSIEIGQNGPTLSCKTLNGNIYIRKHKKD